MSVDLHWENCICDWCGAQETTLLFSGSDLLLCLPGKFTLTRCKKCGLIRQNPRLTWDSLNSFYPDDYSAYTPIIDTEKSKIKKIDRRYGMVKRIRAIEKHKPEGFLLDVGCGTGIFLAEVNKREKWHVEGVEPVGYAANYVKNTIKIEVTPKPFLETKYKPDTFDVITMWNVLEHFYNPIKNMEHAYNLLKPGGIFVFSIPNLESFESKLFKEFWLGWDLPRHLYIFPQKLLIEILSSIGFQVIERRCIAGSHHAFGLSISFWLKGYTQLNKNIQQKLLNAYYSFPSRILLSPFWGVIGKMKSCSLITIIAVKVPI